MRGTWESEAVDLEAGGPSVRLTYRLPTSAEMFDMALAMAELADTSRTPKPGEFSESVGSLVTAVKGQRVTYQMTLALVVGLSVDNEPMRGADAMREVIEGDGRFVRVLARHGRWLFRDRTGDSVEGPDPDRGTPAVPGQPEGHAE